MKEVSKLLILSFLIFFINSQANAQNVFRSVQAGDWNDASTWFSGAGSGGIEGINYPSQSDSVYIDHDVDIVALNSGAEFIFNGYLNISVGNKLQCEVGNSNDGFALEGDGVMHLYGSFYTAAAGEVPSTGNPAAKEYTVRDDATMIAFTGSDMFVADDWEIEDNAFIFIEDNVCLRVDDDVNFNGTGWDMCGDGDVSIGGDGAGSTVNFGGGSSSAQICTGTSIIRNTGGTDCSSGTTVTTGTGSGGAAPTAVDDQVTTDANSITDIDVLYIGTDDSDPAGDTLEIIQLGANGAINDGASVEGGTVAINDNGTPSDFTDDYIVYDPPVGYTGDDSFQYIIEDEEGLTDTATVSISVINCGNSYVDLQGTGANGSTSATLNFTDTTEIDSIRLDLVYKNGKPSFATFTTPNETVNGVSIDAINVAGGDDGVYRATVSSASTVTVTHDDASGVRSFLAYVYRSGTATAITSIADTQVVYLFQDSYSFTQEIQAGSGPRDIKIQMPISELNNDSRSALLEVQAGPVSGSLETFTADLGNSLKIFTLILEDVPGDVTELEITITSKTGGVGDSFITAGIDFGIQCSGVGPDAIDDNTSTTENTAVTIDILNNDVLGDAGFDTSSITNLGLLDPQNGSVSFNASGQAIYTPDASFIGVDNFQYIVCDNKELCAIANVTVTVSCAGGQFVEVAESKGLDLGGAKDGGLSWADLNNDGLLDVVVNTNDGTNDTRVYFAEESAGVITYTDVTSTNASGLLDNTNERSVVTADLNNDGYIDFARNTFQNTGVEIWFNRGLGSSPAYSFGTATQDENVSVNTFNTSNNSGDGFNTEGLAMVDWNQDAWIDIIVENDGDGIEILENNKNGTFSEVAHATSGFSTGSGTSNQGDYSTSIDYDNDGYIDFMARRTGDSDLYRFDPSTSTFSGVAGIDLTSASEKGGITFCDLDQDGDFDFIWARNASDDATVIYLQAEDGTFSLGTTLVTASGIEECDCADVDNDGDNDIFLGDDSGDSYLYINGTPKGGTLSFSQDNGCIDPSADVEGSEFVDYDNDGDIDLYMNINGGDNQLWQNGQDDNNFLLVEPRLRLPNGRWRPATGANVMLIENCEDTCMIKDVSGGRGHGSQKPSIIHFGLKDGPNENYKIIVFYPDSAGEIDTVIKSVTPASLSNQKLIVYQTDEDYDICEDADQDGILNSIDIDDDNDGILDGDEANCASVEAYWTLDNTTDDASGNGNNERTNGNTPGFSTDAIQGTHSASFNGTSHAIRYSQNGGFMESAYTEISFSAWVQPSDISGDRIVYEEGGGTNGFILWLDEGTPTATARSGGGGSETSVASSITLTTGSRWYHLAAIFDNGEIIVYVDGVSNSTSASFSSIPGHGSDGGIGGAFGGTSTGGSGNFAGLIDGAKYSNTVAWVSSEIDFNCDSDGDGIRNHLDLDSDGDGIPEIIEAGGVDLDGDGRVDDDTDGDSDGWADTFDSDNSGTALENPDSDGDGFADRIDLDSDNDGIADVIEAGGTDFDGNGRLDGVDEDGDGMDDVIDPEGGAALSLPDTDNDGIRNYQDYDSDNDGLTDNLEGMTTAGFRAENGDFSNDGWDTEYNSGAGGTPIVLSDKDGDAIPDYRDFDTDSDGNPDWVEGFDDDNSGDALNDLLDRANSFETNAGNPNYYVNSDDADSDGLPNWLEDDDADGNPNFLDPDNGLYQDTDSDGYVDLFDPDNFGVSSNTPDIDSDGEYDFRDVGDEISLPVVWGDFKVEKAGEVANLYWYTETEINNDYFSVERSTDGLNYKVIIIVDGAGNSNRRRNYRAIDKNPHLGVNYYRIKQTDFDGKVDYSEIKSLKFNGDEIEYQLYPNPGQGGELYLEIANSTSEKYLVIIRSASGKVLHQVEFSANKESTILRKEILQGRHLSSGLYFISIINDSKSRSLKYIIR